MLLYHTLPLIGAAASLLSIARAFQPANHYSFAPSRTRQFYPLRPFLAPILSQSSQSSSSSDTSNPASTTPTNTDTTSTASTIDSLFGGDYAGHSATFSSTTGTLIPVPEHLVPESLIEWGQVPNCFEVLSSEDVSQTETTVKIERSVVSVVPEVGCGVDNLDTIRTSETLELSTTALSTDNEVKDIARLYTFEGASPEGDGEGGDADAAGEGALSQVLAWETSLPPLRDLSRFKVETIFALPTQPGPFLQDEEQQVDYSRRIRISFEVIPSEQRISSPITVVVERRTSNKSSGGQWDVGGGLDGRTVSRLIGRDNVSRPFADEKALILGEADDENDDDGDDDSDETTLSLQGNVVVRCGNTEGGQWLIDLILVSTEVEEEKKMISGTTIVRRIMDSELGTSQVECYFQ